MERKDSLAGDGEADTLPTYGLEDQPEGRVITANGAPVAVSSLHQEAQNASARVSVHFPWLAPLVEAAVLGGLDEGSRRQAKVVTPWGDDNAEEYADAALHSAYVAHVKDRLNQRQPWLWPLLDNASATVLIAPAGFCFTVSTQPGAQWDIPDLVPLVSLEAVSYANETKH